jgi:hypothetical protein
MHLTRRAFMQRSLACTSAAAFPSIITHCSGGNGELDTYGGWKGLQGERTGFFHLEKVNGRNWLITPEGNVFFAVALSHLLSGDTKQAAANVYGGDHDKWVRSSLAIARTMGFNCALGGATSPERNINGFVNLPKAEQIFREDNFPFAAGVILMKHPWEYVEGETLPDIYEPAFIQFVESLAEDVCPKVKDDPLVMGYYYGFGAFNRSQIWVNHHLACPPGSPGREAIVNVLIKRYDDNVQELNNVYGTSFQQMSDLKNTAILEYHQDFERRNFPAVKKRLDARQVADFEAILSEMCTRIYKIAHAAIRRRDTNHLIFGSFVKEHALTAESWKAAAPYIDTIAPQHLHRDMSVNEFADAAGLPAILSDEYFGFFHPNVKHGHAGVVSHDARGDIYRANMMRQYKDPQIVGVTHCACMYDQAGKSAENNKYMQNGFHDIQGNPREYLIAAATEINKAVYTHTLNYATPEELHTIDRALWDTWDKNSTTPQPQR